MRTLIIGSAALLGVIAVPAEAQDLGSVVNALVGGGYSYGYQPSYGYQTYGYQYPAYGYGYSYSPSYSSYGYSGYGYNGYSRQRYQRAYSRDREYYKGRHKRRRWSDERDHDENGD